MSENIDLYFEPTSIAVIGATSGEDKGGNLLLRNLLDSFDGKVFPVNPTRDELFGRKCYHSILDIPAQIDLASILIPARNVPEVLEECVHKGVQAVYIGSGGFAEADDEGKRLQRQILDIADRGDIRVWGPNCGGYISSNPTISNCYLLDTRSHPDQLLGGNVALISQSGMMAGGIYTEIISEKLLNLGKTLTTGNRADIDEADILNYLQHDDATEVIGIYQESVIKGREYMSALASVSREKPVVVLKGGRTEGGSRAARSHTGSIAGDDRLADAVLQQSGVIRVNDFRELINITKGFSMCPKGVDGDDIAILTMTGAGAVVGADLLEARGLRAAELSEATLAALDEIYPEWVGPTNPVDIWTTIEQVGIDETLTTCLELLLKDDGVDGIVLQLLAFSYFEDFDFDTFTSIAKGYDTPVVGWLVGWKEHTPYWIAALEEQGIPVYRDMTSCAQFLADARDYATWRELYNEPSATVDKSRLAKLESIIEDSTEYTNIIRDGNTLPEVEAKEFLGKFGISTVNEYLVRTADEAVEKAERIGYPVVLKVASSDIHHKSDVGGVEVDLRSAADVRAAHGQIISNVEASDPEAVIDGMIVQEMIEGGLEVIVGAYHDQTFGPMVMFGLGGIHVEILEDVTFRAAPLTAHDAREMIDEIDGSPLLYGARGQGAADIDALIDVILSISGLADRMDDIISAIDINPLIVLEDGEGAIVVDALIAGRAETETVYHHDMGRPI